MSRPFNSLRFFRDPFFTRPSSQDSGLVTITLAAGGASKTMPCIYRHGLDPQRDGALMQRPGHWAELAVHVKDYEAAFGVDSTPSAHDTWDTDGETFRVDVHGRDGDVFTVKAIGNQRKAR
jgi:hypothetical protein